MLHSPTNFLGTTFNNSFSKIFFRYCREEWDTKCTEDPDSKHIMYFKGKGFVKLFGLKLMEMNMNIKYCGPAHSQVYSDIILLKIFSIVIFTTSAIISTGPLTQRTIMHFYSSSSIVDRFCANSAPKSVTFDVSNRIELIPYLRKFVSGRPT